MFSVLLAIALNPVGRTVEQHVDRIELNHLYDGDGRLVLDQVIFWEWSRSDCRFHVVDWRLIKNCRIPSEEQKREWDTSHPDGPPYVPRAIAVHAWPDVGIDDCNPVCDWYDEKTRENRRVTGRTFIETWTLNDPELRNREVLPQNRRRGLRK